MVSPQRFMDGQFTNGAGVLHISQPTAPTLQHTAQREHTLDPTRPNPQLTAQCAQPTRLTYTPPPTPTSTHAHHSPQPQSHIFHIPQRPPSHCKAPRHPANRLSNGPLPPPHAGQTPQAPPSHTLDCWSSCGSVVVRGPDGTRVEKPSRQRHHGVVGDSASWKGLIKACWGLRSPGYSASTPNSQRHTSQHTAYSPQEHTQSPHTYGHPGLFGNLFSGLFQVQHIRAFQLSVGISRRRDVA